MKILYIDPILGISGDMMISAFLSAGVPLDVFQSLLAKVPVKFPSISARKKTHGVIEGIHLDIEPIDSHLTINQMEAFIAKLEGENRVRDDAMAMLGIILDAEAKIHDTTRDELHLHELSHVDTLMDLLCAAKGMDYFGIEKVYGGPVPHGRGTIRTSHGVIPNPPPVTLEILAGYPSIFIDIPLELTTPTGATIVRHFTHPGEKVPSFTIERTGNGFGDYASERPDLCRIFVGDSGESLHNEEIWLLEMDLDDMEMEYLGAVAEKIRAEGALDVLYFPVYMKKGRLGIRFSVSTIESMLPRLVEMLFSETTTFGIRMRKDQRVVLRREEKVLDTSFGSLRVKYGYDSRGRLIKTHMEFEDVRAMADKRRLAYRTVLEALRIETGLTK
jgi:uncharacterized protein (TIGR00299 family) protein